MMFSWKFLEIFSIRIFFFNSGDFFSLDMSTIIYTQKLRRTKMIVIRCLKVAEGLIKASRYSDHRQAGNDLRITPTLIGNTALTKSL